MTIRPGLPALLLLLSVGAVVLAAPPLAAQAGPPGGGDPAEEEPPAPAFEWDADDPRIGLAPGLDDAGEAIRNLQMVAHLPRPEEFGTNTDIAFSGGWLFLGNYNGFNIYDISDPANTSLRVSVLCPGNQGDLSVVGNLLFKSVQATTSRLDCGTEGIPREDSVSEERFRGVRIFDISDIDNPRQVAAVQTCRGSHTHSLASHPDDPDHVYVYVSGTSGPRPAAELEGCSRADPDEDPNTSYFRIEVIQVPLDRPEDARVVSEPRVFEDPVSGDIAGLWPGGDHGPGTQRTSRTAACHDITTYPALGLAGGACSGNGILFDISDVRNPLRIDDVVDPNFAYWHSATFNNDGSKVLFTDEWGGGGSPRCRETDPPTWGADAIFEIVDGRLRLGGYYKLPVPQTETENCVAHNGSLIPVPGRDIKVQAWYQGGISVFDFTDPGNAYEIAFFDRGPVSTEGRGGGGYWSSYWYNGHIYGSEMGRGLDVFALTPSEHLSRNEIDAALLVGFDEFNAQHQPRFTWPASFVVARAHVDQLERTGTAGADRIRSLRADLDAAEGGDDGAWERLAGTVAELEAEALQEMVAGRRGAPGRTRALVASAVRRLMEARE